MSSQLGQNLIFLIGQPRSGTTLLQLLLSQHPEVFSYSESWILLLPMFAMKEGALVAPAYGARTSVWALQDFLHKCDNGPETYFKAVRTLAETLYSSCLAASSKKFFLDKSPPYYLIIPQIAKLFPEAKIIILLRNPLAVLSSITETWFEGRCHLILSHPVHMHSVFIGPKALAEGLETLGAGCYTIKYEDIVTHPELEMQGICDYLGIPFSEQVLSYEIESSWRLGDPTGVAKHSKPATFSLEKWKSTFEDYANYRFAMSYIEYLGSDLFSSLGYDIEKTRSAVCEHWDRKGALGRFRAKAMHWERAMTSSVYRSFHAQRSALGIEWSSTWNKHYPTFPPRIPNYSMLEGRSECPVSEILRPTVPITSFWRETIQCVEE